MTEFTGGGPAAAALADKMADAWVAFARRGDPNTPRLPAWSPYDIDQRATMVFDNECHAVTDPDADVRRLWATI